MRDIPFNVDAYTARLIGRENVSKVESAIIELVKNSYDADGSICILYYEKQTDTLYLADNGCGMTEEIIIKHWMTIGFSSKVDNFITEKGRIQTGSKGIGRFALDKISNDCIMLTKNDKNTLMWIVDWDDFGERKKITDTYAKMDETNLTFAEFMNSVINLDVKNLISNKFDKNGTIFKLTNLRDQWDEMFIKKIKKSLSILVPPSLEKAFKMYLFTDESNIDESEVISEHINSYDYKITFEANKDGYSNVNVYRNEFEFKNEFDEIIQKCNFTSEDVEYFKGKPKNYNIETFELVPGISKEDILNIGPFYGELYFYKISIQKEEANKYYYKEMYGRKNFSTQFGGIKIYRDEFRVRPYGENDTSNFDWLMLAQRKNTSPAAISHPKGPWRVRAEQIVGDVNISRLNLHIPDQANREGIVETREFNIFKKALISIIRLFEEDRQYVIRKLNEYYFNKHKVEQYKKEINDLILKQEKNKNNNEEEVIRVEKVKAVLEEHDEKIKNLEDEIALLRALATTGIVTNTYVHELKALTNELFGHLVLAKETIEQDEQLNKEDIKLLKEDISDAYSYHSRFNSWFKVTIDSVRKDKRKMKVVNINNLINNLKLSWQEVLNEKKIGIEFFDKDIIEAKCFAYEIESIIHNLITNSVSAFERMNSAKEIKIILDKYNEGFVIKYEDNGPGLVDAYKKDPYQILKSLETSKRDINGDEIGTGMGMWIVSNMISEYNGRIDLDENINKDKGFKISLHFNKRVEH